MQNYAKAEVNYVRISPRKVKIVIDLIRNKPVGEALAILKHTPKAASEVVEKLLLSAMANAENNHGMDVEKLYVAEIYSNAGPMLKRIRARAQGRAFRILKRTSHTTVVLKEREAKEEVVVKKAEDKKAEVKDVVKDEAETPKKTTAKKSTTKKTETKKTTSSTAAKKSATKTTAKKTTAKTADGEEAPKPRKPRAKKADTAKTEEA